LIDAREIGAKGQEWRSVFVLNVTDGCIPSDLGVGEREQIEEERRLLDVAMTRAREHLHLIQPLRFYHSNQHRHGDRYVMATRSRFIIDPMLRFFERRSVSGRVNHPGTGAQPTIQVDVAARMREMWK
jgi:DNA helicase-2/ATP-dependent DNA helicase PcrA